MNLTFIRMFIRRNRSIVANTLLALFAFAAGCASSWRSNAMMDGDDETDSAPTAAAAPGFSGGQPGRSSSTLGKMAVAQESMDYASENKPAPAKSPGDPRIVVYTANYQIVVIEIEAAFRQVKKIAADFGGWVDSIQGNTVTFRVPAARYEEAVALVEATGRIVDRNLKAADITEEYVDLEARLKSAKAVRERLQALLARAEDVKAALEVERELARVDTEIEQIEAKLDVMKNRVAFSTITVQFETVARTTPMPIITRLPFRWLEELDPRRLTRIR